MLMSPPVFLEGLLSLCCISPTIFDFFALVIQASIDFFVLTNQAFRDLVKANLLVFQSRFSRSQVTFLEYQTFQSFHADANSGWLDFVKSQNLYQLTVQEIFRR
jgi:hypothetical protein